MSRRGNREEFSQAFNNTKNNRDTESLQLTSLARSPFPCFAIIYERALYLSVRNLMIAGKSDRKITIAMTTSIRL